MTEQLTEPAVCGPADAPGESVHDLAARILADGRAYVSAEADRQKVRAGIVGAGVRDAAIFGVVAFMLLFAGLVASMVGLILALVPRLGAFWGTLAVFVAALVTSLILMLLAKARISRMTKAIRP
ncbi:hypothetical protein WG907_15455 [Sphingobium sp. AN558]|uniref:hypothetical protein n=1 Tax=Sphingobium sp. AN558 TaxID=3133442 RepID=UPI0030C029A5